MIKQLNHDEIRDQKPCILLDTKNRKLALT